MATAEVWFPPSRGKTVTNPVLHEPKLLETRIPMIDQAQLEEEALVAGLRAGDPAAQHRWVEESRPMMLSIARDILIHEDDACEAVQEAFLSAVRGLPSFDGRSRLSTWVHRITINACLMKLRSRRRRHERPIEDLLPTYVADGHQTRSTPPWPELGKKSDDGTTILSAELAEHVRRLINELPEAYRTMLILRDVRQLSTEEAAAAMGISPAAARVRLHRARQALRTLIEPFILAEELNS